VLDVACGGGRHARYLPDRGHRVVAVDREISSITEIRKNLADASRLEIVELDLEDGTPWPLAERTFACVLVTNYLHRPLFPHLIESIEPGGVLIYETFARGNERFGRPKNPHYLLEDGELLDRCGELKVIAFEQGIVERPEPAAIQRICAWKGDGSRALP
jgi:SAM-dependent methyltransferase